MKHGKKYVDASRRFDKQRLHEPQEAFELVKQLSQRNFDETVEVAFRLGVDPRKADQMLRGTVSLPADMMGQVGKLGRVLGPRGLMPNPKTGTVTNDVGKTVADFKGGKVEYRTDRHGNVHVPIGKVSFDVAALLKNYGAVLEEIIRAKPAAAKGRYIKAVTTSSTMGPGVKIAPDARVEAH